MTQKEQTQAVTPQRAKLSPQFQTELRATLPSLAELLPRDITTDQFRSALWIHLNATDKLANCTPKSIMSGVINAATYGMLPGRDCYLIPFRNRKKNVYEAAFVPDYRGLIRALERTGKVRRAFANPVYSNDHFEVDFLADVFSHKPALDQRGRIVCYYACIFMKDDARHIDVMHLEDIERIRKRSPFHEEGPWVTDTVEMSKKTVLKRLCKTVQLTPQITDLLEQEESREDSDFNTRRGDEASVDLFGEPIKVVDQRQSTPQVLSKDSEAQETAPAPESVPESASESVPEREELRQELRGLIKAAQDHLKVASTEPGEGGWGHRAPDMVLTHNRLGGSPQESVYAGRGPGGFDCAGQRVVAEYSTRTGVGATHEL